MILNQSISIIGNGAVGGALLDFFEKSGQTVRSVWKSDGGYIVDDEGTRHYVNRPYPKNNHEAGDAIFITVPDDQIVPVAAQLAQSDINWHGKYVAHCSGAFSAEILKPVADKGARTASMHPIQTFRKGDDATRFHQIFLSVEGDPGFTDKLCKMMESSGGHALAVDKQQKKSLHIAAVMASNYLVTLQWVADEFLKKSNIEQGFSLLEPLVFQTMDNISRKGVEYSLSGPVERGDVHTIKEHLALLSGQPEMAAFYSFMGLKTLELAEKMAASKKNADAQKEIRRLLGQALEE